MINTSYVKEVPWVKVKYNSEWSIGTPQKNARKACSALCLAKPCGVRELQEITPEADEL